VVGRHNADIATHTFIHKWNEPYLPLFPSRRASPHFGWYSFPSCWGQDAELAWVAWWNSLLRWFIRRRRSPIPVLTGPDAE